MKKLLLSLSLAGLLFATCNTALAATKTSGLQIYPLRAKPSQLPGDTTSGTVTIKDDTAAPMVITLTVERFRVTDEDYNYDFAPGEYTSWIRLADKSVSLVAGESKSVAYSLAVPIDASPGGYYFAIFASTENKTSSNSFKEIKRVASLIYLEVGGQLVKKVNLLGIDAPWFTTDRNLPVDSRLANQGNTHYPARLKQYFQNLIGNKSEPVQKDGLILPTTIRRLPSTIKLPWWPGVYRLVTEFSPPQGGETQTRSQTVVYFPAWAWLVYPAVLAWIIFKIVSLHRKLTRPK